MYVGRKKPAPTALFFNCGFARVNIQETLSEDPTTCQSKFQNQFSECSEYCLSDEQFCDRGKNKSKFEYARQTILKVFTKKWYPKEAKQTYLTTFSSAKWKALSKGEKKRHTLSFCQECREKYYHLQIAFPCLPRFSLPTTTTVTLSSTTTKERELTNTVLRELNGTYVQQFGHTFVDSLVQNNRLYAKDANWRDVRAYREARKTPIGVNIAVSALFPAVICVLL